MGGRTLRLHQPTSRLERSSSVWCYVKGCTFWKVDIVLEYTDGSQNEHATIAITLGVMARRRKKLNAALFEHDACRQARCK